MCVDNFTYCQVCPTVLTVGCNRIIGIVKLQACAYLSNAKILTNMFLYCNFLPCLCKFNMNNLVETFVFKDLRHQLAFSWVIFIDAMYTKTSDFGSVIVY